MSCGDIRIKTAFIILLFTGMRRGELAGLEWEDIDFEKCTINICRTSNYSKSIGIYTKEPKTESSICTISLSETVINQLTEYKEWYLRNNESHNNKPKRLFINKNGGPISPANFNAWLAKLRNHYNLPHFSIHSLRHTNITLQIALGIPLTTVSGRVGHSRTSTTTDIYAHFIRTSDQQAANMLDDIFLNRMGL